MNKKITSVFLLFVLTSSALSFHALGHMVVARIAQFRLEDSSLGRKALAWSNQLLDPFTYYCGEDQYPFVEAATWADKVKVQGWTGFNDWHFKDDAVIKPGYTPKHKMIDNNQNAVWAIDAINTFLSSKQEDTRGKSKSILGKSLSLRQLIHFVGDLHQPLHVGNHITAEHPAPMGDLGGNNFKIDHYHSKSDPWYANSLHYIWDHLFDQTSEIVVKDPMTEIQWAALSKFSAERIKMHSYESLVDEMNKNKTTESWSEESHTLAADFAFKNVEEGKDVSDEYMRGARQIINKRLAIAGYRLADMMVQIYSDYMKN